MATRSLFFQTNIDDVMDITSSIGSGRLLKAPVVPYSVTQTEGRRRAPAADSLKLSVAAQTLLSSDTGTSFAAETLSAGQKPLAGREPSAGKQEPSAGQEPSENNSTAKEAANSESPSQESGEAKNTSSTNTNTSSNSAEELSESDQQTLDGLKRRDAEVKAHEQAHMSAAGDLAQGGASFDYERGPDGKRYAVGGEVSIDTSSVPGDPQATLVKAQRIRRAASAPVDPSSQDRSVAAEASRMETQARVDVSQLSRDKLQQYVDENTPQIDFLGAQKDQNEKNIQDTYTKIQNASVLQEKSFIDFFI